jgi:plastocyanin domain-containing protein
MSITISSGIAAALRGGASSWKHAACVIGLVVATSGCAQKGTAQTQGAVQMVLTESGFDPDHVTAKKGKPLKLVITRKTDQTCAKEIVIDEYNIHEKLPLNTPVTISFTPDKTGQLRYGCAMNKMVYGVLTIE